MAMPVEPVLIGVDVAKAELVVFQQGDAKAFTVPNERSRIRHYLNDLPESACVALEATNIFHVVFAEEAHRLGHTVYLIDGYRLNRYRDAVGARAKTDASDARLLVRYLEKERRDLRPWSPPSRGYTHLQGLLHRRACLVQTKTALRQSLKTLPELKRQAQAALRHLARLDGLFQKRITQALKEHGWLNEARRCQAIEGVGPMTAAALVMAFHRGRFAHSDAYIAFMGLDVRVRDSGKKKGQRKLTKKGDPELRRLLYLAAMTARRSTTWQPFYQRCLDRGMSCIQAFVALARKLARIAFALLKNQTDYVPAAA